MKNLFIKNLAGKYLLPFFLIIPLLLFITTHNSIQKRSFNWLGADYDPSYIYLTTALNNACLESAVHIDHPGTPMQVFGGIILKTVHFFDFKQNDDLRTAVFKNPDHYLFIITYSCLVLNCLVLLFLGIFIFSFIKNFWLAISLQLTPFYSPMMLFHGVLRISQEVFLMFAIFILIISIISFLYSSKPRKNLYYARLFGIIGGFGMACKFLFFPVLVMPLFLICGFKNRLKFILFVFLGFILFTLPVMKHYYEMYNWLKSLFFHTGQYGSGKTGIIDPATYLQNLKALIFANHILLIVILISILIFLTSFLINKLNLNFPKYREFRKALLLVIIAQFLGFILVAKQPSTRYLLCYEGLAGLEVFLILSLLGNMLFSKKILLTAFYIVIVTALIFVIPKWGIGEREKLYSVENNHEFLISWKVFEKIDPGYIKVYCLPSASVEAALYSGNVFAGAKGTDCLKKVFPGRYFVNTGDLTFKHWDGSNTTLDELLSKHAKGILFLNLNAWAPFEKSVTEELNKKHFHLKEMYSGKFQSILMLENNDIN